VDGKSTESDDSTTLNEPGTHDPTYYMKDGDCIIRVERTLFKVWTHRYCAAISALCSLGS
jgi:hypothetical protein